jgi:hypothetical protein
VTAVDPADWTTLTGRGTYVALSDGTIRRLEGGEQRRVAANFDEIRGMAVGVDGSLYVADAGRHLVRRIDPAGRIETVAGNGRPCVQQSRGDCGNGGSATKAALTGPFGVWADPGGQVFIADGEMGVREVGNDGRIGTVMSERPDVHSIVGVASGDLYAATDDHNVKLDLAEKRVTRVVGTGTPGYNGNKTIHGTLAPGTAVQVNEPGGLSVSHEGDVLFADTQNNLVRAYVPRSGHVIDVLAGVVADGSPRGGFNGDGRFARETELSGPVSVAARSNGQFVVADAGNRRVRRFGPGP